VSGSIEDGSSLDDAEVVAPPVKLDVITLTDQFAAERLHGGHMPHEVNNGGVDVIPLTQLGVMFWACNVGRASGQLSGAVHNEWAFLGLGTEVHFWS